MVTVEVRVMGVDIVVGDTVSFHGGRAVVPLNWRVATPKYSQIPGQLNCNIVLIKYN